MGNFLKSLLKQFHPDNQESGDKEKFIKVKDKIDKKEQPLIFKVIEEIFYVKCQVIGQKNIGKEYGKKKKKPYANRSRKYPRIPEDVVQDAYQIANNYRYSKGPEFQVFVALSDTQSTDQDVEDHAENKGCHAKGYVKHTFGTDYLNHYAACPLSVPSVLHRVRIL